MATFGNGARIGMQNTHRMISRILKDLIRARTVSSVAAVISATRAMYGRPAGLGMIQKAATTTWASAS